MRSEDIIIRPLLTEKSTSVRETLNKYTFIVSKDANKIMVKNAIKEMFNVNPLKVNILNVKGKRKRVRYKYGYTASVKKAVITLDKSEKISIFEGV